jgi:hypothetical protein
MSDFYLGVFLGALVANILHETGFTVWSSNQVRRGIKTLRARQEKRHERHFALIDNKPVKL